MSSLSVYILGGSGYGGGELLRLLSQHPKVGVIRAVSRKQAGEPFWKAHPNLRGVAQGDFDGEPDWDVFAGAEYPVVFSAMPHFELAQQLPGLETAWKGLGLAEKLTLIDLSGDFRLDDAGAFERAYGKPHPNPLSLGRFTYGLPEWRRQKLAGAKRIASPGCFATAIQLALLPFAGMKDLGFIAVSAATGSSGSGASPGEGTHHPTRAQDFRAYKVLSHQHEAEIARLLDAEKTPGYSLGFVPHSAPMVRGIHATVQFQAKGLDMAAVTSRIEAAFAGAPFIRLLGSEPPRVGAVAGSNFCDVGWQVKGGSIAVMTAIDNLVKGMAGQAIQCMNLALGFPETEGLLHAGTYPG
ncbi:MAG TPA: N-acetyl-gamma-glutamyl-phosphate reductase [Gammaproteobacteria bacterium]|nr:N-acetyl-gamma-glutamyl-phosphate reductase [Gammaproteobacteria bacterium]